MRLYCCLSMLFMTLRSASAGSNQKVAAFGCELVTKDYKNDTNFNSFPAGEYLIADRYTMAKLPTECGPSNKIIFTETIDLGADYDTLKLSV